MRISDWSSDVCSSDLVVGREEVGRGSARQPEGWASRLSRRARRAGCQGPGLQRRRGVETRLVAVRLRPVVGHGHCSIGEGKRMIPRSATEIAISCVRSEEHTSELQSLMRISYDVFCLKKKKKR